MHKSDNNNMKTINHKFLKADFNNPQWQINTLILGTFNPAGSKEYADYYYGRVKESNKRKSFSNNFWPSLSKYLKKIDNSHIELIPGEYETKEKLMIKFKFACIDLIRSVQTNETMEDYIVGNGYKDEKLFNIEVERIYNTDSIISLIKNKNIKKVIASWGALSPAQKSKSVKHEVQNEINKIKEACPDTIFKIDGKSILPPFGFSMISHIKLGQLIYQELVN